MPKYAELLYNGFWYSPERQALQAAIDETQKWVTGTVRLKLYKVTRISQFRPLDLRLRLASVHAEASAERCHNISITRLGACCRVQSRWAGQPREHRFEWR